jgi:carboxyl-terminal processing protease
MPPRNLTVILLTAVLSLACYHKTQRNRYASVVGEALYLVDRYYLEDVDRRQVFEDAMTGMVSNLDQYSAYLGPEFFQEVETSLDQEFGGVGVEVEKRDQQQPLLVLSPIVGTPAYRSGLRAGDLILEIDGAATVGMELKEAVERMRGEPGSEVRLRIQHAGDEESVEVVIQREVIKVESVLGDARRPDGSWDYHMAESPRIGYLRLTTFGKLTVDELKKTLDGEMGQERPFDALILDLRFNAGGLLDSAVEVCDLFIDEGMIVSTSGRTGEVRSRYPASESSTIVPQEVPVAVLVNQYSASASEIVAACLQDHGRAVVVGSRTWGKGTVQNIFPLEGGRSALKLTTAGYMRPSGRNIHRRKDEPEDADWGVMPSPGFEVPLTDEQSTQLFMQRRHKDVLEARSKNGQVAAQSKLDAEVPAEPIEDTQLRRAVQHLEDALGITPTVEPAAEKTAA